jgi:hypothetical protein
MSVNCGTNILLGVKILMIDGDYFQRKGILIEG